MAEEVFCLETRDSLAQRGNFWTLERNEEEMNWINFILISLISNSWSNFSMWNIHLIVFLKWKNIAKLFHAGFVRKKKVTDLIEFLVWALVGEKWCWKNMENFKCALIENKNKPSDFLSNSMHTKWGLEHSRYTTHEFVSRKLWLWKLSFI